MTIADLSTRGKYIVGRFTGTVFIVGILILSSSLSFGLGMLAQRDIEGRGGQITIGSVPLSETQTASAITATAPKPIPAGGQVVASKTGSVYYLPWCSGALKIPEGNKVWFVTAQEAESNGYTASKTCPGL